MKQTHTSTHSHHRRCFIMKPPTFVINRVGVVCEREIEHRSIRGFSACWQHFQALWASLIWVIDTDINTSTHFSISIWADFFCLIEWNRISIDLSHDSRVCPQTLALKRMRVESILRHQKPWQRSIKSILIDPTRESIKQITSLIWICISLSFLARLSTLVTFKTMNNLHCASSKSAPMWANDTPVSVSMPSSLPMIISTSAQAFTSSSSSSSFSYSSLFDVPNVRIYSQQTLENKDECQDYRAGRDHMHSVIEYVCPSFLLAPSSRLIISQVIN